MAACLSDTSSNRIVGRESSRLWFGYSYSFDRSYGWIDRDSRYRVNSYRSVRRSGGETVGTMDEVLGWSTSSVFAGSMVSVDKRHRLSSNDSIASSTALVISLLSPMLPSPKLI
jgi:hypothetical protein